MKLRPQKKLADASLVTETMAYVVRRHFHAGEGDKQILENLVGAVYYRGVRLDVQAQTYSDMFFLATEALVRGAAVDTASLAVLCCENDVLDPNRTPSKTKVDADLIRGVVRARAAASGFSEHDEKPSSDAIKAVLQE